MKISIIMLTYNAPKYVEHSIKTVRAGTEGVDYELVVYDNHSSVQTVNLLNKLKGQGYIDKLILSDENYYFVGGNNRAVRCSADDSDYILLLNSDVEIRNSQWLKKIVDSHERGITACQVCSKTDNRPDGWCLLVDRDIYLDHNLDEDKFTWYYSIADFGSRVMRSGYSVQTIRKYDNFIKHFGGMSEAPKTLTGLNASYATEVDKWYPHPCVVIDQLDMESKFDLRADLLFCFYNFNHKVYRKIRKIILPQ